MDTITATTPLFPESVPDRLNQRRHQRFAMQRAIDIVVRDVESGCLSPVHIQAVTANVSATGALIVTEQPLTCRRLWIRTDELLAQGRLLECQIVREAEVPGDSPLSAKYAYGVTFQGTVSAVELAHRIVAQQPLHLQ